MIGIWQVVIIFLIVLVLFGAGRIPRIMRDLGIGIRAFKQGIDGDDVYNEKEIKAIKRKTSKKHLSKDK